MTIEQLKEMRERLKSLKTFLNVDEKKNNGKCVGSGEFGGGVYKT